jgi:hypothetical protein
MEPIELEKKKLIKLLSKKCGDPIHRALVLIEEINTKNEIFEINVKYWALHAIEGPLLYKIDDLPKLKLLWAAYWLNIDYTIIEFKHYKWIHSHLYKNTIIYDGVKDIFFIATPSSISGYEKQYYNE